MKKSDRQLSHIINYLGSEIREHYPNIYHSVGKFYISQLLKDLYQASEKHSMHGMMKSSGSGNSHGDVSQNSEDYLLKNHPRWTTTR